MTAIKAGASSSDANNWIAVDASDYRDHAHRMGELSKDLEKVSKKGSIFP